ncbi:MAG: signal recognition particle-docking protein FtsY [Deltaproteobacteria bacterium]|nr:signal recognition particle-docking protein FtsY [Deltaproteobacteria bacterium]
MGMLSALKRGLAKTKTVFSASIEAIQGQTAGEDWESLLIATDMGAAFAARVTKQIKAQGGTDKKRGKEILREILIATLLPRQSDFFKDAKMPLVVMVIGVNGTGKTTTIGKIGGMLKNEGYRVMLCAGDTFRSAAKEQLAIWGERNDIPVVSKVAGADPAAVVFEALAKARAEKTDILLVDTAGRLHTKFNLMEELKKIKRVIAKDTQQMKTLLVLDATTGQNAVGQAEAFNDAVGVDGIVLTKLDGSAKGGIIVRIAAELSIPIAYIGVGEGVDDLRSFDARTFVDALLD